MYNNGMPSMSNPAENPANRHIIKEQLISENEKNGKVLNIINDFEDSYNFQRENIGNLEKLLSDMQTKFNFYEEKFGKRVTTCTKCKGSGIVHEHYSGRNNCGECEGYKFVIKEDESLINRFIKDFEDINKKQITEKQFLEIVYNQLRNYE